MPDESGKSDFHTVARIVSLLEPMSREDRERVLATVSIWLEMSAAQPHLPAPRLVTSSIASSNYSSSPFAPRDPISAKEFLLEKEPRTDADRVACLAYYLTHYRDTPEFKTVDISRLNTEAAQRKFSNAAQAMKNAVRDGFLTASAKKGFRQLSAMGEQYVNALPSTEDAREVRRRMIPRRGRKPTARKATS